MLCRFAHVQSVTFFAHAVVCTVILRRGRGSATFGSGRPRHTHATGVEGAGGPRCIPGYLRAAAGPGRPRRTRATSVEGASGPRCIPGYLRAAAGPGRASRSTTPSRRLACGDLAGGPPPSGTKTGSPGQESTANPGGGRARRHPEHRRRSHDLVDIRLGPGTPPSTGPEAVCDVSRARLA